MLGRMLLAPLMVRCLQLTLEMESLQTTSLFGAQSDVVLKLCAVLR